MEDRFKIAARDLFKCCPGCVLVGGYAANAGKYLAVERIEYYEVNLIDVVLPKDQFIIIVTSLATQFNKIPANFRKLFDFVTASNIFTHIETGIAIDILSHVFSQYYQVNRELLEFMMLNPDDCSNPLPQGGRIAKPEFVLGLKMRYLALASDEDEMQAFEHAVCLEIMQYMRGLLKDENEEIPCKETVFKYLWEREKQRWNQLELEAEG